MNVASNFSFHEYSKIASRDELDFADFGTVISLGKGEGSTYTFQDNGSDVLGVAHLDTVQGGSESSILKVGRERVLLSPRLDDRLGVYIITRLLPRLGIKCDWLLTTGEEIGSSSAEFFISDKTYNWSFSFDRAGTDVVLYQFDHKALRKLLRKAGFTIGQGMFSDLSFIDIGCSGINFGCGYQDNHSRWAYARLSDTFKMVKLFARFWGKYHNVRLPYNDATPDWGTRGYYSGVYGSGYGYAATYGRGYVRERSPYLDWWQTYPEDVYGKYSHNGNNGEIDYEQLIDDAQEAAQ